METPPGMDAARRVLALVLAPGAPEAWLGATPAVRREMEALAADARVELLLHAAIRARCGDEHLPHALAARANAAKAGAAWIWVEAGAALEALEGAGLAPIALKGADLAARAYPSAFRDLPDRAYLRHATDLDVLLSSGALAAAGRCLGELGFRQDAAGGAVHHVRWHKAGPHALSFTVELHEDLFDRPHGLRLELDAMRARATRVETPSGDTRRVLSFEDALLHVAGHAVFSDMLRDRVPALRGPVDAIALARAAGPRLDASTLASRAASSGLAAALSAFLEWSAALAPLPPALRLAREKLPRAGLRGRTGARIALANARRAVERGASSRPPRAPATLHRALLAPRLLDAAAMVLEGARRRVR